MVMLKEIDFKVQCSTDVVNGLSEQILAEMNRLLPNTLVSFADLNVSRGGQAAYLLLQPAAKEALRKAVQDRGTTMVVNSDYRTIAQQLLLFRQSKQGKCGIALAARPGRSNHQSGCALDIQDAISWKPFLEKQGWQWYGKNDPVHFDYVGAGRRDIRSIAVLAFQRLWNQNNPNNKIAEDGIFGDETEERLVRSPSEGFSIRTGIGSLPENQQPPIQNKSNFQRLMLLTQPFMGGEDIRQVQQALIKAGIDVKDDGIFGENTKTAVVQFQQREGLIPDGIVGPATLTELELQ